AWCGRAARPGRQPVNGGCVQVESESVIPVQGEIDEGQIFSLPVSPGTQNVVVDLTAEIESKSQAKSTGLFGSLSGAGTAGISMPGSVRLGNFTGPGGGPLPAGPRPRSLSGGMTYADPRSGVGVPDAPGAGRGVRMANPYRAGGAIRVAAGPAAWGIRDVAGRGRARGTGGRGA